MDKIDYQFLFENAGSPKDYSDSFYLVYFELGSVNNNEIKEIISSFCSIETELKYGYLCKVRIQNIPEIVGALSAKNHGVYQVVRLVRIA